MRTSSVHGTLECQGASVVGIDWHNSDYTGLDIVRFGRGLATVPEGCTILEDKGQKARARS